MLNSDEIDDDYFSPIPNTSLKNIFGSSLQTSESEDLLKYVPPTAEAKNVKPTGETANKCIFACALRAYEWSETAYKSKGKVGLAIIKDLETGSHFIVLYDSNKIPQSKTSVTPDLNISMKDNVQFSFYDDQRKYWVLAGSEKKVSEIRENLQNIGVKINSFQNTNDSKATDLSNEKDNHQYDLVSRFNRSNGNIENETESSDNMKSKVSILNRMASMGQSVLPRQTLLDTNINRDLSSSSPDSDSPRSLNSFSNLKKVHHQTSGTFKARTKKEAPEMIVSKVFQPPDSHATQLCHMTHGQVVPFTNTTSTTIQTVCANTSELNNFMSEQRVSNTELRININKTNDKVDKILEILKTPTQRKVMNSDFEIDIMKKLLNEYEEKIKKYEKELNASRSNVADKDLRQLFMNYEQRNNENEETIKILRESNLKMQADYENQIVMLREKFELRDEKDIVQVQCFAEHPVISPVFLNDECNTVHKDIDTQTLKNKIKDFEDIITEKSNILMNLQLQIQEDNKKSLAMLSEKDSYYAKEIDKLNEIISKNVQESEKLDVEADVYENKLKEVMNKVFQLIAVNFENDELYSGESVKKLVAAIIKKTTVENFSNNL